MDQAIILAAGEGQRLRPLTVFRPKVMLSIGNKPILQYVLEAVAANGIRNVLVVVGYRKEQVQDYFGSGEAFGIDIKYIEQKQQLGTAHALKQAENHAGDRFLVISGDNIIRPSTIASLLNANSHTILVRPQENVSKYGVVLVRKGIVTGIIEKPTKDGSNLVNTGIYAFTKDVFAFIGDEVDLPAVLMRMVNDGTAIRSCETADTWLDVVYPWDMLKLNALVLNADAGSIGGHVEHGAIVKGPVSIGQGSIIRSGCYLVGPAAVGKNCEIGPHVCILPSTSVGDNVVLSAFSSLKNSIVGNNVQLGPFSHLEDSIVAGGSRFAGHFTAHSDEAMVYVENEPHRIAMGTVVGEHSHFGPNIAVSPGIVIGNRCHVEGMKLLHANIPDGCKVV